MELLQGLRESERYFSHEIWLASQMREYTHARHDWLCCLATDCYDVTVFIQRLVGHYRILREWSFLSKLRRMARQLF